MSGDCYGDESEPSGQSAPGWAPDLRDILEASARIRPIIHRTPVLTCAALDAVADARLFFKCENFQKIGAFKIRGAARKTVRTLSGGSSPKPVPFSCTPTTTPG